MSHKKSYLILIKKYLKIKIKLFKIYFNGFNENIIKCKNYSCISFSLKVLNVLNFPIINKDNNIIENLED